VQPAGQSGPKTARLRVPAAADAIQVNHCRMPSCANFGIPARTDHLKKGRAKGQSAPRNLPNATVASCPNRKCVSHGKSLASSPDAYSRYGILRLDRLRLRGPCGARDEFLLAATAQNLRKLAKLIPMPQPMAAS
jgi:hypothetical protein